MPTHHTAFSPLSGEYGGLLADVLHLQAPSASLSVSLFPELSFPSSQSMRCCCCCLMPLPCPVPSASVLLLWQSFFIMLPSISWWFSTGVILPPRGHLAISGNVFGCHNWGGGACATGIWWVEARDAAEYPAMHSTAPWQVILPKRFVVLVEKSWYRLSHWAV